VSGAPIFGNPVGYNGVLDVSKNWWGSVSGPTTSGNPGGTGSKIRNDNASTTVISYGPWATSPAFTSFTAGPGVVAIGTQLYIGGGSTSNDKVKITPIGASNTGSTGIKVQGSLNGVHIETTFTQSFTAINIFLQDGNEDVDLAKTLTIATIVVAGNGNDEVELGNGANTVILGNGNDHVEAGDGRNTIFLGGGNDHVELGNGNYNSVTIIGNGNDHVEIGDGNYASVTIIGNGNDHVELGDGNNDSVSVFGNGNDKIEVGDGSGDFISMIGNGNDDIRTGDGSGHVHVAGTGHKKLDLDGGWTQI
jgi:hypothetical protein